MLSASAQNWSYICSYIKKKAQTQLNQDYWVTTTCVSEVVKCFFQFRELWTDRMTLVAYRKEFYIWRFPGYPWSYHKRAQLADSLTHCWTSPVSHTGVKAQAFSTDSCCHIFNQPPQMGPPILPFGRVDFHSNGHLRKRHLGPAWCHIVTNSELLNHYITEWNDLLAPVADSVIQGALKMHSVLDFTHSVTCLCSWIVLLEQLN